jgi:predicted phage terminase large subunit-like protein
MLIDFINLDKAYVKRFGLLGFIRKSWHLVESSPFIEGWHIGAICERLEAVHYGEIKDLVINIPPGCMKSLSVSVFFPSWEWILSPEKRWICSSYSSRLVYRDARKCKSIIASKWFQNRWGDQCAIDKSGDVADTASEFWTTAGGLRFATTIKGEGTGWHAHRILCDDPLKPRLADATKVALEDVINWWKGTMSTRRINQDASRVVIMQRLHENDLAGYCIERGYHHLCLPMRYRTNHPFLYTGDIRTKEGELLWPEHKTEESVKEEEIDLGPIGRASQHDQLPTPAEGGVFKLEWLENYWTELPKTDLTWCQSWDHSLGTIDDGGSYVAGHVYAMDSKGRKYLIDRVRRRMTYPEMRASVRMMKESHPEAERKYFEKRACGLAVKQDLEKEMTGIVMVGADASTGGKLVRAHAVTGILESGDFLLPHPTDAILRGRFYKCPWVEEFKQIIMRFKGADGDESDDVDAMSQALTQMNNSVVSRFAKMKRMTEV